MLNGGVQFSLTPQPPTPTTPQTYTYAADLQV